MEHSKSLWLRAAGFLLVAAFGCGSGTSPSLGDAGTDAGTHVVPKGAALIKSDKARDTAPDVAASDRTALGDGNRKFGLDLYAELRKETGNLFLSPYSISVALAMTYAGAKGDTASQIASALHFDLEPSTLHATFDGVDLELASRGKTAKGKDNQPFQLHIVNQTFGQKGFMFLPSYLDTLALNYGAGLFLLDFETNPEGARTAINDWIASQTAQRIKDLIAKGVITSATKLVLTNAIYFNAAWRNPFDEKNTQDGSFSAPSGDVSVKMMKQTAPLRYTEGDGYQAVELPYDEPSIAFVAVLPSAGRFDEIEAAFDQAKLQSVLDGLSEHSTTVTMPRFSFEAPFDLKSPLQKLGMVDGFMGGKADFSGIDGSRDLFVQAVVHKAFVAVDEAGTEAAAATAVIIGKVSLPEPASITLDRPFLFAILDQPTGELLFFGRVVDPS